MNRKFLFTFSALLMMFNIFSSLVLVTDVNAQYETGSWWNADWKYRRPIKIANLLNQTLEGYEVLVTADTRTLVSEGKMRPDCGDIRFTTFTQHEIPHWIESGSNTNNTRIWIRVPTIASASNITIYMYYGNPNASSKSSGDATFEFFDDFLSYNTSKWTEASFLPNYQGLPQKLHPTTVDEKSVLYMETTEQPENRLRGMGSITSLSQNNDVITELVFQPLGDLDGVAEIWMFDTVSSEYIWLGLFGGNYGKDRVVIASLSGNMVRRSSTVWSWGEWLKLRIQASGNTINTTLLDINDNIRWSYTFSANLSRLLNTFKIALSQHLGYPYSGTWHMKSYVDRVIVRKYANPEPVYVIGEEEHLFDFPHVESGVSELLFKKVSSGKIAYDTFSASEGTTTDIHWTITHGDWTVENGKFKSIASTSGKTNAYLTGIKVTDFIWEAKVKPVILKEEGPEVRFIYTDDERHELVFDYCHSSGFLRNILDGRVMFRIRFHMEIKKWYTIRVEIVRGDYIKYGIDGGPSWWSKWPTQLEFLLLSPGSVNIGGYYDGEIGCWDDIKIWKSNTITVTNLQRGQKVELYDRANNLKASDMIGVGETKATLDVSALTFPFVGYFKIYATDGVTLLYTTPLYDDIWGGDEYSIDRIKAEINIETLIPGSILVTVSLNFEYDGLPVEDAVVRVNNIVAENIGNGKYRATLSSWMPSLTINIEAERAGFEPITIETASYALGNILLETSSITILSIVAILKFHAKRVQRRRWRMSLRQLEELTVKKGRLELREASGAIGVDIAHVKALFSELIREGRIKGSFTSDGKGFVTEEKLKEEIMRGIE